MNWEELFPRKFYNRLLKSLKDTDTIVFDFDGTIADSLHNLVVVVNELAGVYNFQKFGPDEVEKLRALGFKEIINLIGIKKYQLPKLAFDVRTRLKKYSGNLKPVKGVDRVVQELSERGYKLGILTSNFAGSADIFLSKYDLVCFDFVYSEKNLLGKGGALKKLAKKYGDIVYVGDETRDVEACKKVGVKVVAVTWGYNSRKPLQESGPNRIVSDPTELLKIFNRQNAKIRS